MSDIFLKIVNMSISAGWIVLAVLLLRLLLTKAPKWINCILWGIVGLRLIMPFSLESVFSLIPSTETISKTPESPRPYFESGITIVDNQVNDYLRGTYFEGVSRPMGNFIDITSVLGIIWFVGIIALLLYTVISYVRLKKKIGTAVLYKDNIFQSESVISPFVLGIIKPKIYLPFNMSDSDMENVVAHEQAHIKRKDHLWKPLGFLLLTIHWFNPLMWVGYIMLCKDIELACDEKVVKNLDTEQRADYSQALLSCSVNRRMIAACPLAFGEVGVKSRIKTVLNYKKPAFWIIIIAIIASIVAAVCFLTNPISSNTMSKLKIPEAPNLFDNVTEIQVTIPQEYFDEYYVNDYHFILDFLQDIKVLKKEISKSRSEDRATEYNVILKSGDTYEIIHFDKECKVFWIDNGVKPSFSYQVVDNESVKDFFEKLRNQSNSNKITWSYRPMLSFTGHYAKAFSFDFDYTHIEATCTDGEMWNLEVEGQPRDTTMQFEKGKNVYWTPSDEIEKIPQKTEVTLKVYNNKTQLHKCTVIFECVSRDFSGAEFEIYLKDSDGLEMMYYDGRITFVKQSSISNVGGADNPNNIITEIVDRTVTERIPTDQAMQPFCADEKYIYSFPSIRSEYVIVKFNNGDEMPVSTALGKGLITIADLDKWKIQYNKKEYDGDLELNENGDIVRISSYPKDIFHTTLSHFQALYEETPADQVQEKLDNGELVIRKMHYYNTNKEWCADGYTYKYRLEITGRMNNAAKDSTYIVLSNKEDITFEQTWKASGLSSLSTDYFKPEEAVIVGYK